MPLQLYGGGRVRNGVDTHDRLVRDYTAADGCIGAGRITLPSMCGWTGRV